MDREVILTEEGHRKLTEEIEYLTTQKRREVAERIKEAREFGDISENSEYDDAKNEQAAVEHRIQTLEQKLRNARVVEKSELSTDAINVGSVVSLREKGKRKDIDYTIVGAAESDPRNGKLSNESPIGKALMGHKVGDMVTIPAPRGAIDYKVVKIAAGA